MVHQSHLLVHQNQLPNAHTFNSSLPTYSTLPKALLQLLCTSLRTSCAADPERVTGVRHELALHLYIIGHSSLPTALSTSLRLHHSQLRISRFSALSGTSIMKISRVLCVLLLLAVLVTTEAARIETFNGRGCTGAPTNTFFIRSGCQRFNDQSSVRITEIGSGTRVSIHNQRDCETYSSVAQIFGPGCVNQGATRLRAVFIQG